MQTRNDTYTAIVSSDWNQCLAPCGPFDFIAFTYPELSVRLEKVFKQYTGSTISLGHATRRIQKMLPAPITAKQMDAYLDKSFMTYNGVTQLIDWCSSNKILFMINTTGAVGYFQRVFAKDLLPRVPVLSAHPMVVYPQRRSDPHYVYDLLETRDKAIHTAAVARRFNISCNHIILMGDSGGDGPHFEWGAKTNAFLIASMMKPSLAKYCLKKNIHIHIQFGVSRTRQEKNDLKKEPDINFMDLSSPIEDFLS